MSERRIGRRPAVDRKETAKEEKKTEEKKTAETVDNTSILTSLHGRMEALEVVVHNLHTKMSSLKKDVDKKAPSRDVITNNRPIDEGLFPKIEFSQEQLKSMTDAYKSAQKAKLNRVNVVSG